MKRTGWRHPAIIALAILIVVPFLGARAARAQLALNIPSGTLILSNGTFSFTSVSVSAGATLVIGGSVILNVTGDVDIEGTLTGAGLGYGSFYNGSLGPGAGGDGGGTSGGGGGGHGGTGGSGQISCSNGAVGGCVTTTGPPVGLAYDSLFNPLWMGSAGGASGGATNALGGPGGALLLLNAPSGNVTINGTIDMSGSSPATLFSNPGAGGGAGGTLSIDALGVLGSGTILANGGQGGAAFSSPGGGGGGGRIRLCVSGGPPTSFTGTISVLGGPGGFGSSICGLTCFSWFGVPGQDGSYYNCGPTATFTPTSTDTPTVTPTPSPTSTPTNTLTATPSSTPTGTPTMTPTITLTVTPTLTTTATPTSTPTPTPTPLPCPPGYTGVRPPGPGECFTYPAPAVGSQVHFVYFLKEAGKAEILVRNEKADLVADPSQDQGCGVQETTLDLARFAAGIYFYQVKLSYVSGSGENLRIKKFMVLR